ncbi:MAG: hypothetical protein DI565_19575 [Ancylobacter novellus]|uniref:Uncharacterized protein n=1 Tax=Ancylobacter novellus TaxID=921 RepID=A0A2W5MBL4_ANCNO|nr:MAG: hypothetical protein DI565_19575 [Ancylobacter novellus]
MIMTMIKKHRASSTYLKTSVLYKLYDFFFRYNNASDLISIQTISFRTPHVKLHRDFSRDISVEEIATNHMNDVIFATSKLCPEG